MTARKLSLEARDVAYANSLHKGLCPNSGQPCDRVADLDAQYAGAIQFASLGFGGGIPLGYRGLEATTAAFDQMMTNVYGELVRVATEFEKALGDTEACIGGCALGSVNPEDASDAPR